MVGKTKYSILLQLLQNSFTNGCVYMLTCIYIVCHIRFNVSSSIYTHVYRVYYYPLNNVNIHSRNSVWSVHMTINRHAIYSVKDCLEQFLYMFIFLFLSFLLDSYTLEKSMHIQYYNRLNEQKIFNLCCGYVRVDFIRICFSHCVYFFVIDAR